MRSDIFRKRVDDEPNNPLFRFSLGHALYQEGAWSDAVEALHAAIELRPDWMMAEILLGKALREEGNAAAARRHLERALDLAIAQEHEDPQDEIRDLLRSLP